MAMQPAVEEQMHAKHPQILNHSPQELQVLKAKQPVSAPKSLRTLAGFAESTTLQRRVALSPFPHLPLGALLELHSGAAVPMYVTASPKLKGWVGSWPDAESKVWVGCWA